MNVKSKFYRMDKAQAYAFGAMSSTGKAANMLMRQYQFPAKYDPDTDHMSTADSDRLLSQDYKGFRACLEKHLGNGEMSIGDLVRATDKTGQYIMSDEQVFDFIKEALKVAEHYPEEVWTGYRVTGTVNRSSGYPVYSLSLFANKSGVDVYSGEDRHNVDCNLNLMFNNMGIGGFTGVHSWGR